MWDSWMGKGEGGGFAGWNIDESVYWEPALFEPQIDPGYGFWGGVKDFGSGALDFSKDVLMYGSQLYGAYKTGQATTVDRGGLAYNLPGRSGPAEPMRYTMQSAAPATPAGTRVSFGSQPGGAGLNMNMVLIGGAALFAAFMMKGK